MKKYRIHIGRPGLSDSQINSYKDFDWLYNAYQKARGPIMSRINNRRFILAVAATVAILFTIYLMVDNVDSLSAPFINPPMAALNVQFASYTINANTGATLFYKSGSKIKIPANAFVNKNGNIINGEVKLQYREFHDPVDFFLSGIPMTYDSAGTTFHFESAGMMEINAIYNGEPVYVNQDNQIQIEMASVQPGNNYNLYYLDTVFKKWINKGKDSTTIILAEQKQQSTDEVTIPVPLKPEKPRVADESKYRFDIKAEGMEELVIYKGIEFEIEDGQNFNPRLYDIIWDDIRLTKIKGKYKITLVKGNSSRSFVVYPVVDEADYENALKVFDKKYREYLVVVKMKKKREKEQRKKMRATLQKLDLASKLELMSEIAMRSFAINSFGIWNWDKPIRLPEGAKMLAKFEDENGNPINSTINLKDKRRNSLFRFRNGWGSYRAFQFNPKSRNLLWTVLPEGKLAVFRPEDFDAIDVTAKKNVFTMAIIDKEFESFDEIKKVLSF